MKFLNCLKTILVDSWAFLLIIFVGLTDCSCKSKLLYFDLIAKFQLRECINRCFQQVGYDFSHAKKVVCTEYSLIFVVSALAIFLTLLLFTICPATTRIASHVLIPVLMTRLFPLHANMSLWHFFLYAIAIMYLCCGVYRTTTHVASNDELADHIVGGRMKRTSRQFFASTIVSLVIIAIKIIIFRLLNFHGVSLLSRALYTYFMIAEFYIIVFSTRCSYGLIFCRARIPGFRNVSVLEFIPLFFTVHVAGLLKPINLVMQLIYKLAVVFGLSPERWPVLRFLESNHSRLYYAVIYSTPYFLSSVRSYRLFWHGEIKKQISRLHFVESILPITIMTYLFFESTFKNIVHFFRPQDVAYILFVHYFFVIEIFYTHLVIDILQPCFKNSGDVLANSCIEEFRDENMFNILACADDSAKDANAG